MEANPIYEYRKVCVVRVCALWHEKCRVNLEVYIIDETLAGPRVYIVRVCTKVQASEVRFCRERCRHIHGTHREAPLFPIHNLKSAAVRTPIRLRQGGGPHPL